MSRTNRFERHIDKLEKNLEKYQKKMQVLTEKHRQKKISGDVFFTKKNRIVDQIKGTKAQIRLFKGGLMKEKKYLEEKKREEEN